MYEYTNPIASPEHIFVMTAKPEATIFALSSAIGGILGQNYGAALMPRVRTTFRDALTFCVGSDGTRPSDFKSEQGDG